MALTLYEPSLLTSMYETTKEIAIAGQNMIFRQHGRGTGSLIWPASELLSNFFLSYDTTQSTEVFSFEGKRVIELGAGIGVLACALLHLGAKVFATDGEESVVETMNENIQRNSAGYLSNFTSQTLRWGENITDDYIFDYIVAADVVYGEDFAAWRMLRKTLEMLCQLNPQALVLIAQTRRYPAIEATFFSKLETKFEKVYEHDISGVAGSLSISTSSQGACDVSSTHLFGFRLKPK